MRVISDAEKKCEQGYDVRNTVAAGLQETCQELWILLLKSPLLSISDRLCGLFLNLINKCLLKDLRKEINAMS